MVSRDGRATFVVALFKPLDDRVRDRAAKRIEKQFAHDPTVALGGGVIGYEQVGRTVEDDLLRAETIAFPLLILLSFWVFRGLVAALLPPLVGALTILLSFLGLRLADRRHVAVGVRAQPRHRHGARPRRSTGACSSCRASARSSPSHREGAVARTIASAGRTVVFSSLTVAAAMASLLVFPQRFLLSMGVGGVLVSLDRRHGRADRLARRARAARPARQRARAAPLARVPDRGRGPGTRSRGSSCAVRPSSRPRARRSCSLLGVPFLRVTFTAADARVLPESASARQVYEQLGRDFTRPTVPFYAVLRGRRTDVAQFATRVSALRGSPRVLPPRELAPGVWKLDVFAGHDYLSGDSQRLVHEIRALPTPLDVLVGGGSAGVRRREVEPRRPPPRGDRARDRRRR